MLSESRLKGAIRDAGLERKQKVLKDPGEKGAGRLAFIARPLASRVSSEWYAIYYRDGKRALAKLGSYPDIGLAEARRKFRAEFAPTILKGAEPKNPYARRCNKKSVTVATVRELFEAYVADLKANDKDGSAYTAERILLKRKDSVVQFLGGDRAASDIQTGEIVSYLSDVHARGKKSMAGNMRAYIRAAYAWGIAAGNDYTKQALEYEFGLSFNPVEHIPVDDDWFTPGDRALDPEELKAFHDWLQSNRWRSTMCGVLLMQIFTGQRIKEVMALGTGTYIPEEGVAFWPKTKNGMPHSIPLCSRAKALLDSMHVNEHGHYFPHRFNHEKSARLNGPSKIVDTYLRETGAVKFVARDLRRTWKTLAGKAGLSLEIRDRYQNHVKEGSKVSRVHYDRYDRLPELQEAMKKWDSYLDSILRS